MQSHLCAASEIAMGQRAGCLSALSLCFYGHNGKQLMRKGEAFCQLTSRR